MVCGVLASLQHGVCVYVSGMFLMWFEEPVGRPRVRQVCLCVLLVSHAVFGRVASLLWCSCACWLDNTKSSQLVHVPASAGAHCCDWACMRPCVAAAFHRRLCWSSARWMPASTVLRLCSAVLYAAL